MELPKTERCTIFPSEDITPPYLNFNFAYINIAAYRLPYILAQSANRSHSRSEGICSAFPSIGNVGGPGGRGSRVRRLPNT